MIVRPKILVLMHFTVVILFLLAASWRVSGFTFPSLTSRQSRTVLFAKSILLKSRLLKKQVVDAKLPPKASNSSAAAVSSSSTASIVRSTAENIIRSEFTKANTLHQLHRIDWIQGRCEIIVSAIPQPQQPVSEPEVTPTVDELQALQTRIYTKLEAREELTSLLAVTEVCNLIYFIIKFACYFCTSFSFC